MTLNLLPKFTLKKHYVFGAPLFLVLTPYAVAIVLAIILKNFILGVSLFVICALWHLFCWSKYKKNIYWFKNFFETFKSSDTLYPSPNERE